MIQIRIYENVKVYQVYTQKYIQENYYGFKKNDFATWMFFCLWF